MLCDDIQDMDLTSVFQSLMALFAEQVQIRKFIQNWTLQDECGKICDWAREKNNSRKADVIKSEIRVCQFIIYLYF